MTGVLNAMVGAASRERTVVLLGDNGGGAIGISGGSVAPGTIPIRTTSLLYVDCISSGATLRIYLDTVLSQTFFKLLRVQNGAGAMQSLDPSSASFFSTAGSQTQWHWTVSSFWTSGDVGESKLLEFVF